MERRQTIGNNGTQSQRLGCSFLHYARSAAIRQTNGNVETQSQRLRRVHALCSFGYRILCVRRWAKKGSFSMKNSKRMCRQGWSILSAFFTKVIVLSLCLSLALGTTAFASEGDDGGAGATTTSSNSSESSSSSGNSGSSESGNGLSLIHI